MQHAGSEDSQTLADASDQAFGHGGADVAGQSFPQSGETDTER